MDNGKKKEIVEKQVSAVKNCQNLWSNFGWNGCY